MSNDNDTLLYDIMEEVNNPARFRCDGIDDTPERTTMYFTAYTAKEAQSDDR